MSSQQFCLKWNNHTNNMMTVFQSLLSTEALVDVTLACDGLSLKAHKIVLSACSPFFQSLFLENPCKHPIVILKDTSFKDLKDVIDFMYKGEVNVAQDRLPALLKTAETLKIKGLAEVSSENRQSPGIVSKDAMAPQSTSASHSQQQLPVGRSQSPPGHGKRKRGRFRKRSLSDSNRSEDDIVPSKIKEQPGSPEIEELSCDTSVEASDSRQQGSNLPQSRVHHRSAVNFSSTSHRQSLPSHQATHIESPSGDDTEFEVEPSKLLEQSLTTPTNVSATSSTPTSMSLNFPTSGGTEISRMGSSKALVAVSSASDSGFSHTQDPDSPQDIKPVMLTLDEPTSSAADPSHQSDSSMMYIDQSSMPGPSDFQDQSIVQHDSQAQGENSVNQLVDHEDDNFSNMKEEEKDPLFDSIPEMARQIATFLRSPTVPTRKSSENVDIQPINWQRKRDEKFDVKIQEPLARRISESRLNRLFEKLARRLADIAKKKNVFSRRTMAKLREAARKRLGPTLSPETLESLKQVTLENLSKCDRYDNDTRTCWFDRQPGETLTLSVQLLGTEELRSHAEHISVQWKRRLHRLKHGKDFIQRIQSGITSKNSDDHLIVGSGGLRISPIKDVDMDYNSFQASVVVTAPELESKEMKLSEINFRINIIPIDMGYVYLGEEIIVNIEDFIKLPSQPLKITWKKETPVLEVEPLSPNMRVKNNGKTLLISELSEAQQGILVCAIYSEDSRFLAKRRFLIRKPEFLPLPLGGTKISNRTITTTITQPEDQARKSSLDISVQV